MNVIFGFASHASHNRNASVQPVTFRTRKNSCNAARAGAKESYSKHSLERSEPNTEHISMFQSVYRASLSISSSASSASVSRRGALLSS